MNWGRHRLGELLDVQNGYAFDSKSFSATEGVPLIRIRDLKRGNSTETRYAGCYDKRYIVHAGDLLIGMDGEFGCYQWSGEPALLNQRVCRLRNFRERLLPRFLYYGVNRHLKAIEDVTGFTTVKHLSSKQILGIEFAVPPLPEQRRIVSVLDEAFVGIATANANAEKNLRNARALFDSRLSEVFNHGEWPTRRLGDLAQVVTKGTTPTSTGHSFVNQGINFVKVESITKTGQFLLEKLAHISPECHAALGRSQLAEGDILFSIAGALGRTALVTSDILPANTNQALAIIRLKPDAGMLTKFVLKALSTGIVLEQIDEFRGGAAQQNLSLTQVREFRIAQPPITVQSKFVEELDTLNEEADRLVCTYDRKRTALDAVKISLLQQAFAGQLSRKTLSQV